MMGYDGGVLGTLFTTAHKVSQLKHLQCVHLHRFAVLRTGFMQFFNAG